MISACAVNRLPVVLLLVEVVWFVLLVLLVLLVLVPVLLLRRAPASRLWARGGCRAPTEEPAVRMGTGVVSLS